MASEESDPENWLPSGVSVKEAIEVLRDPDNVDFYRLAARVLENTTTLGVITKFVDPELLVKEFQKIRNHMKHGKLDESTRDYWEEKVKELSRELGLQEELGRDTKKKRRPSPEPSGTNGGQSDEPVPVDPASVSPGEAPSSAADTGKTGKTGTAGQKERQELNLMGGVGEEVGFNERVSEASKTLAEELRKLRQKRDLTRNELSERSEIPLQLISEIERGRKELTYDLIQRYADGLNMTLELDFQKKGDEETNDLLQQVKRHIDKTIDELDVKSDLAEHTRIVLHQLAEDGLYRNRFPTLRDALNYLEEAVKDFTIRDDSPDTSLFSNEALYNYLKSSLRDMDYSDLAYDENIKIVGQKVLERFHE